MSTERTTSWDWKRTTIVWNSLSTWERENILWEARKMQADHVPYAVIARHLNVAYDTLRRRLDPHYAEVLRARSRHKNGQDFDHMVPPPDDIVTRQDVEARRSRIPPDTRTLTQRMFGDPLPGRSALDRRTRQIARHFLDTGALA